MADSALAQVLFSGLHAMLKGSLKLINDAQKRSRKESYNEVVEETNQDQGEEEEDQVVTEASSPPMTGGPEEIEKKEN